jgi:uncharacterized glyoxalase superfamily protein PhnB
LVYEAGEFAVIERDAVQLTLWVANKPDVPGAEPFIAGTASCRIQVDTLDELYAEMTAAGTVHPNGPLQEQWWGVRDFAILDPDNNLITLYEPTRG